MEQLLIIIIRLKFEFSQIVIMFYSLHTFGIDFGEMLTNFRLLYVV